MQVASRANANSLSEIRNADGGNYWMPEHPPHDHNPHGPEPKADDIENHHERNHKRHDGPFEQDDDRDEHHGHGRGRGHGRKLGHHGIDNEKAEAMYGDHEEKHHEKEGRRHHDKEGKHHGKDDKHHEKKGKHHDEEDNHQEKDDKHHEKEGKHHKKDGKHHERTEDLDFSKVDAQTMKKMHKVDRVHLKMNVVGMIFCTLLFGLAMLGFRASKQNKSHKARRYFKKTACVSLILLLLGIYGAHLRRKFHHKLDKMFDHQMEYLISQEEQKSRNLREINLYRPNAGSLRKGLNTVNEERMGHLRNGKKTLTFGNDSQNALRDAPRIPNKKINGRKLMPEKDLIH